MVRNFHDEFIAKMKAEGRVYTLTEEQSRKIDNEVREAMDEFRYEYNRAAHLSELSAREMFLG